MWTLHLNFRLIFTTCDKIDTLANMLTSFWRRCRGLWFSYLVVTNPNLRAIILYFFNFILFYLKKTIFSFSLFILILLFLKK